MTGTVRSDEGGGRDPLRVVLPSSLRVELHDEVAVLRLCRPERRNPLDDRTVLGLATAGLGAVWASCAPEFGARSVVDRFGQVEPAVLLAIAGYGCPRCATSSTSRTATSRCRTPWGGPSCCPSPRGRRSSRFRSRTRCTCCSRRTAGTHRAPAPGGTVARGVLARRAGCGDRRRHRHRDRVRARAAELTPELVAALVDGVQDELAGVDTAAMVAQRDAILTQLLTAKADAPDLP